MIGLRNPRRPKQTLEIFLAPKPLLRLSEVGEREGPLKATPFFYAARHASASYRPKLVTEGIGKAAYRGGA